MEDVAAKGGEEKGGDGGEGGEGGEGAEAEGSWPGSPATEAELLLDATPARPSSFSAARRRSASMPAIHGRRRRPSSPLDGIGELSADAAAAAAAAAPAVPTAQAPTA